MALTTYKLYDEDSYIKSFEAEVLECTPVNSKDNAPLYEIILDKTCFFPTEGGQECDKGVLRTETTTASITNVKIKNNILYHYSDKYIEKGTLIYGEIFWSERYSKMQQHTGEHILSGLIYKKFGYSNTGFHLGDFFVTLDFKADFTTEELAELEAEANNAIYENKSVICYYPSKEELSKLEYRSKIEIEGDVRIVKIDGYDICACCAPHVKTTGEIGVLKIVNSEHFKGGTRITILCGNRALSDYKNKLDLQKKLSVLLNSKPEAILETVENLMTSLKDCRFRLLNFQRDTLMAHIATIDNTNKNLCCFVNDYDVSVMRTCVNELMLKTDGYAAVFNLNPDNSYNYLLCSRTLDSRIINNYFRDTFNARGGGSFGMVQGTLYGSKNEIKNFFSSFKPE